MSVSAIILAAGRSTRMKSRLPKVLHEVCGRTMLEHVLRACYSAEVKRVMVVVGYGKDEVIARFKDDTRIHWVEQSEQLGTGHAARMCVPELKKLHGDVFVLAGDGPMIRGEVLRTLLQAHRDDRADASMATAVVNDPFGYGRIVRDSSGEFLDIVEQQDCTETQKEIREVFPSYYCLKSEALIHALGKLKNENRKKEYYLTDVFGILRREGKKIVAVQAVTEEDVLAANSRSDLANVDDGMQARIQRELRESGVTIVNSASTYIESGASIGTDTVIQPFSFIGRDSTIGSDCVIGPFASLPRSSVVKDGTRVAGNISAASSVAEQYGN